MPDEVANINLRLALDRAALQQSTSGVDKLARGLTDLKTDVRGAGQEADAAANKLSKLGDEAGNGSIKLEGLRRAGSALSQLGLSGLGGGLSQIGDMAQVAKELAAITDVAGPASTGLTAMAGSIAAAVGPAVAVAAPLILLKGILDNLQAAADAAAKAQKEQFDLEKENLDRKKKVEEDARTATLATLRQREKDLQRDLDDTTALLADKQKERAENDRKYAELGAAFNPEARGKLKAANEELDKEIQELGARLKSLGQDMGDVVVKEKPLVQARQDDESATKRLTKAHQDQAKAARDAAAEEEKAIDMAVRARNRNLESIRKEIEMRERSNVRTDSPQLKELTDSEDRQIAVIQRYNAEKERIDQQSLEARANIEKKYADKLVDIARQAADERAAALRKSEQALADLLTSFVRDEEKAARDLAASQLEAQISAERDEAKAYRDHQHDLERIRKAAQDREFEMIQNRDFLGLFNSRRQTSRDIESSNDDFMRERNERRIALAQKLEDLKQNAARERQEHLIAYQQQRVDAQQAYQREMVEIRRKNDAELRLANQAHQRELSDLNAATRARLTLLRSQGNREMAEARLVGDTRIRFLEAERRRVLAMAVGFGNSNQSAHHAGGGSLDAGDMTWVNERRNQRERFNGTPFPPGLGLFQAAQPGNVSAGPSAEAGGSKVIHATFNIKAIDPAGTRREVLQVLHEVTR
jgi:hypothetical protein